MRRCAMRKLAPEIGSLMDARIPKRDSARSNRLMRLISKSLGLPGPSIPKLLAGLRQRLSWLTVQFTRQEVGALFTPLTRARGSSSGDGTRKVPEALASELAVTWSTGVLRSTKAEYTSACLMDGWPRSM